MCIARTCSCIVVWAHSVANSDLMNAHIRPRLCATSPLLLTNHSLPTGGWGGGGVTDGAGHTNARRVSQDRRRRRRKRSDDAVDCLEEGRDRAVVMVAVVDSFDDRGCWATRIRISTIPYTDTMFGTSSLSVANFLYESGFEQ